MGFEGMIWQLRWESLTTGVGLGERKRGGDLIPNVTFWFAIKAGEDRQTPRNRNQERESLERGESDDEERERREEEKEGGARQNQRRFVKQKKSFFEEEVRGRPNSVFW